MAKPKAPVWLREAFRDGVDERWGAKRGICWLAQHDPARRPCAGPLERFHFIPRQRVENAMGALLPEAGAWFAQDNIAAGEDFAAFQWMPETRRDLILLAAWDPRNGGLGCEHHHRRFDGHACSPQAPRIVIPQHHLPHHVLAFAADYGFEEMPWFRDRFPMPSVPGAG